ncbi:MAG: hypothetical protein QXM92_02905 [Candidatus Anstonellales archaeon]
MGSTSISPLEIQQGDYILVLLPYTPYAYLPFQVVRVESQGRIHQPSVFTFPAGTNFTSLISGFVTSTSPSTMPEFSKSQAFTVKMPMLNLFNKDNIFEAPIDRGYNDGLIFYCLYLTPPWLRIQAEAPIGTIQNYYQFGRVAMPADGQFGYRRGMIEVVQPPPLTIPFVLVNDTNMVVRVSMNISYAEMRVKPIQDPYVVYELVKPMINEPSALVSEQERIRHLRAQDEIYRRGRRILRIALPLYTIDNAVASILDRLYGKSHELVQSMYRSREEALAHITTAITEVMPTNMGSRPVGSGGGGG